MAKEMERPEWVDQVDEAFMEGVDLMGKDPAAGMQKWLEVWQGLQRNLPGDVDTIKAADEIIGTDTFFIRNLVWDMLDVWRGLVGKNRASSAQAAAFVEEARVRFRAEPGDFLPGMAAELAYFLGLAGRIDDAEELCRRLIAEHPKQARGYCTLADVYLEADPPQPERALEVLQQAADYPVEDPHDWSLSERIAEARDLSS